MITDTTKKPDVTNKLFDKIKLRCVDSGELFSAKIFNKIQPHNIEDVQNRWDNSEIKSYLDCFKEYENWSQHKKFNNKNQPLTCETFTIECEKGITQGLMIASMDEKRCRLESQENHPLVYIEFLEIAPWNHKDFMNVNNKKYKGIASIMVAVAIKLSIKQGFNGRVGLHSLPEAEGFYSNFCAMSSLGADKNYDNLPYFEFTAKQAKSFLEK